MNIFAQKLTETKNDKMEKRDNIQNKQQTKQLFNKLLNSLILKFHLLLLAFKPDSCFIWILNVTVAFLHSALILMVN